MRDIVIIHENPDWLPPLGAALDAHGLRWREWRLDAGVVELDGAPPPGVFFNRMSASAHTRGHRHAPDLAATALAWLERCGRRVVNGSRALALEMSKAQQCIALEAAGLPVPRTIAVVGAQWLESAAARHFGDGPLILKPNRGGKGLGVRLFEHSRALAAHLASSDYEPPVDGVHLLQRYIRAPEPYVTRAEFVGGRFLYAVRVDASDGFAHCPAEACAIAGARAKFEIHRDVDAELIGKLEGFLAANGIDIAGVEFIRDAQGRSFVYDVNANTNYNPDAEARAGVSGPQAVAAFLHGLAVEGD